MTGCNKPIDPESIEVIIIIRIILWMTGCNKQLDPESILGTAEAINIIWITRWMTGCNKPIDPESILDTAEIIIGEVSLIQLIKNPAHFDSSAKQHPSTASVIRRDHDVV